MRIRKQVLYAGVCSALLAGGVAATQAQPSPCKLQIAPDGSQTGRLLGSVKCARENMAGRNSAAAAAGAGQNTPQAPQTAAPQTTAPPAASPQSGTTAPKSAAQKFPYPGEAPSTAETPDAPAVDAPSAANAGQSAGAPAGGSPQTAAKRFPYPGEAPSTGDAPGAAPASGSWSSSSSSSSGSADDPNAGDDANASGLKDAGSTGESTTEPNTRNARRRKLAKINPQTNEERGAEDIEVADYYQKSGNFNAAYARAKDAITLLPDDPGAHLALAEAARKLGKRDEAQQEYAAVLQHDPAPKELKASRQGLAELSSGKK